MENKEIRIYKYRKNKKKKYQREKEYIDSIK